MNFPTPHGDKLRALLGNHKLPAGDRPRVHAAIERYEAWIEELRRIEGAGENLVEPMVEALNRYKLSIDLDLIFDSKNDFLYRQKGQLKLDNTVLEEFMPWLVRRVLAGRLAERELTIGPANAFAQLRFDSDLRSLTRGGNMAVRSKDHDFVLARPLYLKASHRRDFEESREARTHLAYVAAEIKTNLDKTMFQEASATAHDLKIALPGSRYFLLCEWLDMIPISSAATAIEQGIVRRKARRLRADVRGQFATLDGRTANRAAFERHLTEHPFTPDVFQHFLSHLERLLGDDGDDRRILARGWF